MHTIFSHVRTARFVNVMQLNVKRRRRTIRRVAGPFARAKQCVREVLVAADITAASAVREVDTIALTNHTSAPHHITTSRQQSLYHTIS